MRQSTPQRRGRGRPSGRRGFNNSPNRSYDSSGPDIKIRGTAATVYDKYQSLGRDAVLSGDRVAAENFFQHAEHYYRLVQAAKQQAGEGEQRDGRRQDQQIRDENSSSAGEATPSAEGDGKSAVTEDEAVVEVTTNRFNSDADNVSAADADATDGVEAEAEAARARSMNPAELAAMSESGRRSRGGNGAGGRGGDSQIRSGDDLSRENPSRENPSRENSSRENPSRENPSRENHAGDDQGDNAAETADAAPRRQPRRRRRPAPDLTAVESESAPVDTVEDVESN